MPSFLAGIIRLVLRVAIRLLDCPGGAKIRRQKKQEEEHEPEAVYASIVAGVASKKFSCVSCTVLGRQSARGDRRSKSCPDTARVKPRDWCPLVGISQALVPSLCPLIAGRWGRASLGKRYSPDALRVSLGLNHYLLT
jgi:hypothetical protein